MDVKRKQRVTELIKETVSQIVLRDVSPRVQSMITIMRVEMSDDLKYAKLFISVFGPDDNKEKAVSLLKRELKSIRKKLGGVLRLRYVPYLSIVEDQSLDHAFKIEELLKKIQEDGN